MAAYPYIPGSDSEAFKGMSVLIGLVVTMGLMRVINLAHGAFAAIGGYVAISLMQQQGWPYALAVPAAVLAKSVEIPYEQFTLDNGLKVLVHDLMAL
mgnify:CR=1 FL=1